MSTSMLYLREASGVDLISIVTIFLAWLALSLYLYQILAVAFTRSTLGISAVGLRLALANGRRPHMINLIARAIAFPLSLLCFGYVPLFFGKRALHDRLAGTEIFS